MQLKIIAVFISLFILNACATYKPQYKSHKAINYYPKNDSIAHSFYLIGDAGNSKIGTSSKGLKNFEKELNKATKNSTAIFLGDNIYPKGMPKKKDEGYTLAAHQLLTQTESTKKFKGKTIFIPGNHDWYSNGLKGLKRQENYIEKILGNNSFLPQNGCPLKKINISNDIVLIIVDSEWYLTNWDDHPTINDNCKIKTRTAFFDEFESLIKKARGKTTLVAIHHPLFSNGPHGGQYSFKDYMSPLPVLGTLKNVIRKTGGVISVDNQNKVYNEFRKRIITLSQENNKTIFVSGHDHSLQYIIQDNLPQIISGSGSKISATKNVGGGLFSYGEQGFAKLDVFKNGAVYVSYYANNKIVFQTKVFSKNKKDIFNKYPTSFPKHKTASIYSKKETQKEDIYKIYWGDRYREDFSTEIKAPTVNLDTLFGGLTVVRKGGGHQSKSLRLKDKNGSEYVMRALRKNAVQYLQAVAFKDQYIEGQFNNTYTEELLLDVFTGSHPYAPFTIGKLADAANVFHTNPKLYYVPKQSALKHFSNDFGDELYMIEERASNGHGDKASFGYSNKLISTNNLLKTIHKDENITVDEASYIRARLFDMLIGDWDRHEDQWRWAEFKNKKQTIYKPVPRDRDQAFSIMADGILLSMATKIVPSLRLMKSYSDNLKNPKWFNLEPYPLDMALINQSDKNVWDAQVKYITENLTDQIIDEAFKNFPPEINQNTIKNIKQKLIGRRGNLQEISDSYYKYINKFTVIKGTNKDDWFDIERMPEGKTKITAYRIKKGEKKGVFHQKIYHKKNTKEIWVYALDDNDRFEVFGDGNKPIKIRLIGGQNKDTYNIKNDKNIKIYDYKTKKNKFLTNKGDKKLTDNYKTNTYNYKKLKHSTNQLMPSIGINPDDGLKIGFINTFTNYGFENIPFSSQQTISTAYYFATKGFDLNYRGEFTEIIENINLGVDAIFTSPNYAINFFGYGNSTPNPTVNKNEGLNANSNYNRVKLKTLKFNPSLIWKGRFGAKIQAGISFESIEVEETQERFISTPLIRNNIGFINNFYGIDTKYEYANSNNKAFPTLAMKFGLQTGYKNNLKSKGFGYIVSELGFDYKLVSNGRIVLASKVKSHINLGNDFEFYQAANIGGNNGLRAYRNQRFTGKNSFVQSTDLRLNVRKIKTSLLPLNIGFYGSFDYGKVWIKNSFLLNTEHNSQRWNTSIGGGVFANAADMLTFNLSAFSGNDGLRLAFKLGFGF